MEYVVTGIIVLVVLAIIGAGIVSSRKPKAPLDPNVKKAAITTFLNLK